MSIQGRIESGDDDVEVELLRPFEWLEQNLAETTTGEVGLWIEFPEVEIRGFVADLVLARFERPTDWSSIGSGSSMPVISILRSVSEDVGTLTVESEQIGVTGGHWIWSRTQGRWVDARRLGGCESLAVADGGSVAVEAPFVRSGSPATVWTLEVVGARTFKVGRRRLTVHNAADYGSKWPEAAPGETRVSRWMSQEEYDKMRGTGTLQEGGGGFTYVTIHGAAKPGGTGPVRADFNVPTGALDKAGRDDWKVIREPHRVPVNGLTRGN